MTVTSPFSWVLLAVVCSLFVPRTSPLYLHPHLALLTLVVKYCLPYPLNLCRRGSIIRPSRLPNITDPPRFVLARLLSSPDSWLADGRTSREPGRNEVKVLSLLLLVESYWTSFVFIRIICSSSQFLFL